MLTYLLGWDLLPPLHPNTCAGMENLIILGARENSESFYLLYAGWCMLHVANWYVICTSYVLCARRLVCIFYCSTYGIQCAIASDKITAQQKLYTQTHSMVQAFEDFEDSFFCRLFTYMRLYLWMHVSRSTMVKLGCGEVGQCWCVSSGSAAIFIVRRLLS